MVVMETTTLSAPNYTPRRPIIKSAGVTARCNWTRPIVSVCGLRKTYQTDTGETVGVKKVSFDVMPGQIVGILGPEGSGKTTIVECIAGLRQADAGNIRVFGIDVQADPGRIRDLIGIQFQESQLKAEITVAQALELFGSFYPTPASLDNLISLLKLDDKRDEPFQSLTHEQRQRLSIALALIGSPKIAIFDELTSDLSPAARQETGKLIELVRDAGVTIILVTNCLVEVEKLCDQIVVIADGEVVGRGTPAQLIAETPGAQTLQDVCTQLTGSPVELCLGA